MESYMRDGDKLCDELYAIQKRIIDLQAATAVLRDGVKTLFSSTSSFLLTSGIAGQWELCQSSTGVGERIKAARESVKEARASTQLEQNV